MIHPSYQYFQNTDAIKEGTLILVEGMRSKEDLIPQDKVWNKEGELCLRVCHVPLGGVGGTFENKRIPDQGLRVHFCAPNPNGFTLQPKCV